MKNQASEKSKLPRGTHFLENADKGISQESKESKGKRASEGHSRTESAEGETSQRQ